MDLFAFKGNLRALLFRVQRIGKAKSPFLGRKVFFFFSFSFIEHYSALSSHSPIDRPLLQYKWSLSGGQMGKIVHT